MQYRKFGKLDWQCSALGFGCMRFPSEPEGDYSNPLEEEAIRIVRAAIDQGINYMDTAYPYHDGKSEVILGKALQGGYRDRVKIATKMPCWLIERPEDFDRYLDLQLERLQTDSIDFYLLHAVWKDRWDHMKKMNLSKWADKVMASGKIKHMGFSFHDGFPLLKQVIDEYDNWTVCQIQYNYLNEEVQAGTRGLAYGAEKGLAMVIMEPLMGGYLANPPQQVKSLFDEAGENPADLALRWIWNHPEVATVLSGMRSMADLQRNLASAEKSGTGNMTPAEAELIKKAAQGYQSLNGIPCTKCRYCMPCPQGLDIPRNFELFNGKQINPYLNKALYDSHFNASEKASNCVGCGVCEAKCPQRIKISEWMPKIHEEFVSFAG